jgi:hypothetical protein
MELNLNPKHLLTIKILILLLIVLTPFAKVYVASNAFKAMVIIIITIVAIYIDFQVAILLTIWLLTLMITSNHIELQNRKPVSKFTQDKKKVRFNDKVIYIDPPGYCPTETISLRKNNISKNINGYSMDLESRICSQPN